MIVYDCVPLLSSYAESMYSMRLACESRRDRELTALSKLLCNTIVGKLAAKNREWRPRDNPDNDVLWGEWLGDDGDGGFARYRSVGGNCQREYESGYAATALPAVTAFITAHCRMMLWEIMEVAGSGHVYYCDTDGIIVDDRGRNRIMESALYSEGTIGRLGTRWTSGAVQIRGIKDYTHDGVRVCSGMPATRSKRQRINQTLHSRAVTE